MFQRAERTGAVEHQQRCTREQDSEHLQLKHDVQDVKVRHPQVEKKTGNHIDAESSDAPWNESMKWTHRQLLQESEYAEIENSNGPQEKYQAEEVEIFQNWPNPHRRVDHEMVDRAHQPGTEGPDSGRRVLA